jgi:hypothetical protein
MDGLPSYVPACLRSSLPMFRPTYTSTASSSFWIAAVVIVIDAVHLLFKWNIYLSLLCDWIIFFLQNYFSFLSSKSAVEACDVNNYC